MINLLEQAYRKAEDARFKNDLIAKGFTQVKIDNLKSLRDQIHQQNILQEDAYDERPLITVERVDKLNKVFSTQIEIHNASVRIFADQPTKLEQYLLYPDGRYSKKNETDETNDSDINNIDTTGE